MKPVVPALALTACITAAQPVQRVDLGPAPAGPWAELHEAIDVCAAQQGVPQLTVRVAIDPDGGAGSVSADQGGSELAECIGRSLVHTRFPRDHRGVTLEVPFSVARSRAAI
jgi:hypothetical protein